jgi:hypothetical protein
MIKTYQLQKTINGHTVTLNVREKYAPSQQSTAQKTEWTNLVDRTYEGHFFIFGTEDYKNFIAAYDAGLAATCLECGFIFDDITPIVRTPDNQDHLIISCGFAPIYFTVAGCLSSGWVRV